MNGGYEVSLSHCGPNTVKTNAPNTFLWEILRCWYYKNHKGKTSLKPDSAGSKILERISDNPDLNFEARADVIPLSKEKGFLRYQVNPAKFWGPGVRNTIKTTPCTSEKRIKNQGKRRRKNTNNS